jgi:hypothetical protein
LLSTLLFRREVDGHGVAPPNLSFRVRESRIRDNRKVH